MTKIKVIGLLGLIIAVWIFGHARAPVVTGFDGAAPVARGRLAYGGAMLAAMTAFNGWANVAMAGGEVQEPKRNLPWALVLGICLVAVLYVAANLVFLHVLSMNEILSANSTAHPNASSVASRAAIAALGHCVGIVLPLLFMVSTL